VTHLREQILLLFSAPIYLVIIGIEVLLSNYQHRKLYNWKDTAASVYLMLLNSFIDLVFRAVYVVILDYFYQHQLITFTNAIAYWLLLVLAEDFLYYWLHRFDHEIRFFWAMHVTHHSSQHMNFTVGFRSSVFQPLYRFIYFIPLAWLGFKPLDIVFIYSATQIWGIFVHTELIKKMGWLEHILVTPSHHRVHHASNAKYLDRNMGMFLIIWDKLFGTFQEELAAPEYEPIKYGLTKPIEKETPVTIVFHEWDSIWKDISRKDIGFKEKFAYIFGPPGWSHDGSRLTSDELRQQEAGIQPSTDEPTPAVVTASSEQ
jgi:sterol desaturase/sphingolipid hydroxylase (fatty acid hydroxylase superfamily)